MAQAPFTGEYRPAYTDGILFTNTHKCEVTHPDFVGKLFIRGKRVEIIGYMQVDKKGKPQIALAIKR
jgi:hypothetical protein